MKLPSREVWMRTGYSMLGGAVAIGWDRYLSVRASGGAYVPPALLASYLVFSENAGSTEKDIGAAALGYLTTAQILSFSEREQKDSRANPQTLDRVREISGTIGAVLDVLGKMNGNSND